MTAKENERILFERGTAGCYGRMLLYFLKHHVVLWCIFARRGYYHNLGVEGGVETSDEIAKTIEHAERAHHGGCRHYNSPHGNRRDEVDGVVTLLGEEIAESNDVGE